jgi:hypothetical protein
MPACNKPANVKPLFCRIDMMGAKRRRFGKSANHAAIFAELQQPLPLLEQEPRLARLALLTALP